MSCLTFPAVTYLMLSEIMALAPERTCRLRPP